MDAKDLLLNSLDEHEADYRGKLKLCRADFSQGAVHDLRTSIRRLLATLDVVAFFTSESRAEKLSDRLKDQLDGVGDLRDVQVMLDRISEDVSTLPELESFHAHLKKHEKRKEHASEKYVADIKPGSVKKRLSKIREAVDDLSAEDLNGKLPQTVDEAYLTVLQRYGWIDPEQLISIHHLRVAFKEFRYRVEVIHSCLPDFPADQLEHMHEYQTQMGDIHDIEVLLDALAAFAKDNDSFEPEPVRRFYERVLADALSAYLKSKEEVLTFWRATPLAPFPWEANQTRKED